MDGDEGVLFEASGPGVINRIWMTSGEGKSDPLNAEAVLRIYIDEESEPIFEGTLPSLFDGSSPPFLPPLVGNRESSSGGNFSYVPIPYNSSCRITLSGPNTFNLWFQFNHYELPETTQFESFTGNENLSDWRRFLNQGGPRSWTFNDLERIDRRLNLSPGDLEAIDLERSGTITGLRLQIPRSHWSEIDLVASFDGETTISMRLADFFAQGHLAPTHSALMFVGSEGEDLLYSTFPMPFSSRAEFTLNNRSAEPVSGRLEIDYQPTPPGSGHGLFGAQINTTDGKTPGEAHTLLKLNRGGKWVGLVAELSAKRTRQYLEGDERVFIDGDREPTLHGTGTEDFFNTGFYFDHGPVQRPLHGAPWDVDHPNRPRTSAYRWMVSDAITFQESIFAELESGPTGDIAMWARTVAYYYVEPTKDPSQDSHRAGTAGQ